jgi:hypothetical protein
MYATRTPVTIALALFMASAFGQSVPLTKTEASGLVGHGFTIRQTRACFTAFLDYVVAAGATQINVPNTHDPCTKGNLVAKPDVEGERLLLRITRTAVSNCTDLLFDLDIASKKGTVSTVDRSSGSVTPYPDIRLTIGR